MNINPLYNDLSKFDIVKIKTNKPPLCEICGEEMEKVFLTQEPKCGRKKIKVDGVYGPSPLIYKQHIYKNESLLPEG